MTRRLFMLIAVVMLGLVALPLPSASGSSTAYLGTNCVKYQGFYSPNPPVQIIGAFNDVPGTVNETWGWVQVGAAAGNADRGSAYTWVTVRGYSRYNVLIWSYVRSIGVRPYVIDFPDRIAAKVEVWFGSAHKARCGSVSG